MPDTDVTSIEELIHYRHAKIAAHSSLQAEEARAM